MKQKLLNLRNRIADAQRYIALAPLLALPAAPAHAGAVDTIISSACGILSTFIGPGSKILSLVFLLMVGVFVILLWMSENKEGPIAWGLKTMIVVSLLINVFTLPPLIGMASVC